MTATGDARVVAALRSEIGRVGPIPFARFMDVALYHSEGGYYAAGAEQFGAGGDYDTSPAVAPAFGRLLARQVVALAPLLPQPLEIIEIGAGRGILARDLLAGLAEQDEGLFTTMRYAILEASRPLIERQRQLLAADAVVAARVAWLDAWPERVNGVVLSNELADAFPVHVVVGGADGLQEMYVGCQGDAFIEQLGPPSCPELAAYLARAGVRLVPGQRAEINLAAVDWMRAVGRRLTSGFVITFDYGHTAYDLYAHHRRRGTLLAYHRHVPSEEFYQRIGQQDLTAHVDFTTLALVGHEEGLAVTGFTNQMNFLLGLGIGDEMERLDPASEVFRSLRRLIQPGGMGETFKVLVQHKGVSPPALAGLRYRPYRVDALFAGLPAGAP